MESILQNTGNTFLNEMFPIDTDGKRKFITKVEIDLKSAGMIVAAILVGGFILKKI